jgi:hypothetical protein
VDCGRCPGTWTPRHEHHGTERLHHVFAANIGRPLPVTSPCPPSPTSLSAGGTRPSPSRTIASSSRVNHIDGVVNSTAIQSLQTLQVTDNYIEVADGLDYEVTGAAEALQNGLRINTVPNGGTMVGRRRGHVPQAVQELQRRSRVSTPPVCSTRQASRQLGTEQGTPVQRERGSAVGGAKTQVSRDLESYWDVLGGAMKSVVPSATDDLVHRRHGARVTNGELEIVRQGAPDPPPPVEGARNPARSSPDSVT